MQNTTQENRFENCNCYLDECEEESLLIVLVHPPEKKQITAEDKQIS